jgi:hypothetical protein
MTSIGRRDAEGKAAPKTPIVGVIVSRKNEGREDAIIAVEKLQPEQPAIIGKVCPE